MRGVRVAGSGQTDHQSDFQSLITPTQTKTVLNWWSNLGIRGKLIFWGIFGLVVNGLLFLVDLWMPKLLFIAIGMFVVALFVKGDTSTDL